MTPELLELMQIIARAAMRPKPAEATQDESK